MSDRYSQIYDSEDEEDFTQRLAEAGQRLKRRSTMVSTFGFQRPPINYDQIEEDAPKLNKTKEIIEEDAIKYRRIAEPVVHISDKNQAKFQKLLIQSNKRKISLKRTRGVAFWFMNQLGRKLRKHVPTTPLKNGSNKLNSSIRKLSSISSEFDSEKDKERKDKNGIPMSPIKRRRDIGSPNLNEEQNYFLKIWSIYKSENFLTFSNVNLTQQRNQSATPVQQHKKEFVDEDLKYDDVQSWSKLEVIKKNMQNKESTSSDKESPIAVTRIKHSWDDNIINLKRTASPNKKESMEVKMKSPYRQKRIVKKKKKRVRIQTFADNGKGKLSNLFWNRQL